MRRRRDAASADVENVVPDATADSSPIIDNATAPQPEPAPAKPRRRTPALKRKPLSKRLLNRSRSRKSPGEPASPKPSKPLPSLRCFLSL